MLKISRLDKSLPSCRYKIQDQNCILAIFMSVYSQRDHMTQYNDLKVVTDRPSHSPWSTFSRLSPPIVSPQSNGCRCWYSSGYHILSKLDTPYHSTDYLQTNNGTWSEGPYILCIFFVLSSSLFKTQNLQAYQV